MTKFRIIRPKCLGTKNYDVYVAQYKWLNLIWMGCEHNPDLRGSNISFQLDLVDQFIEHARSLEKTKHKLFVEKVYP